MDTEEETRLQADLDRWLGQVGQRLDRGGLVGHLAEHQISVAVDGWRCDACQIGGDGFTIPDAALESARLHVWNRDHLTTLADADERFVAGLEAFVTARQTATVGRRVLAEVLPVIRAMEEEIACEWNAVRRRVGGDLASVRLLKLLALLDADHPDYRREWQV